MTAIRSPGSPRERRLRFIRKNRELCAKAFDALLFEAECELVRAAELKQLYGPSTQHGHIVFSLRTLYWDGQWKDILE